VAPPTVHEGNAVAISNKGTALFLIRPSAKQPRAFRFARECYMHGIMNSEAKTLYFGAKTPFCDCTNNIK